MMDSATGFDEGDLPRLREDLAAAYRICAAHRFNEGVCNHLTVAVTLPPLEGEILRDG